MSAENAKLLLAIEGHTDIEKLRSIARRLVDTLGFLTKREEGNYEVVNEYGNMATGSKEFCLGYAQAYVDSPTERCPCPSCKVMCGEFEVWPNWGGE